MFLFLEEKTHTKKKKKEKKEEFYRSEPNFPYENKA
jgi:hypothetical protein